MGNWVMGNGAQFHLPSPPLRNELVVAMPEIQPGVPFLQINDSLGRRLVPIDKPLFRIGRRHENDLCVEGGEVSREHAEIIDDGGRLLIRDCSSRFGTFVNGERVTARPLRHGDHIRLGRSGSAEFVFLLDGESETAGAYSAAIVDFRRIARLLDDLRSMGSARVLDDVLALVVDTAIEVAGAERGFIMLADETGALEFKIGRTRSKTTLSGRSFDTSQKIPQDVFASGRDQVVADLTDANLASDHLGTIALGIRNVLCTPLRVVRYFERPDEPAEQRPIGVLYLDSREKGHLLSPQTRAALERVAIEAASAIESTRVYREATEKIRLERELRLAAEIQQALLPEAHHSGPHFEVTAASVPCRAIGGDFFDYFTLPDGTFGLTLGDVAGKGPPAALLAALIQGTVAAYVTGTSSPAALMALLNQTLIRRSLQPRFATLFCGMLCPDGRFTSSNAGHNPPLLLGRRGTRRLETGGPVLGVLPETVYDEEMLVLEEGDLLVVFSDGITEALNAAGEEFGEARAMACLEAHRHRGTADVLDRLLAAVREFSANAAQHDDMTALVLRYGGPAVDGTM
jgi:phosphoserine phosphatase RsbU/P